MTMPQGYRSATRDFERYIDVVREETLIESRNVVYTMTQGVFQVFRRRVSASEALMFADLLPPVLRAIFVADWQIDEPRVAFGSREEMTSEAKALRRDHNFSPDSVLMDVASGIRAVVDKEALERVLAKLPAEARDFWRTEP